MNYGAAETIGYNRQAIPIGDDWRRINFALAGYGYILPATRSAPVVVDLANSSVLKTEVVLTSRGN